MSGDKAIVTGDKQGSFCIVIAHGIRVPGSKERITVEYEIEILSAN